MKRLMRIAAGPRSSSSPRVSRRGAGPVDRDDTTMVEFFERRVRPLLVDNCYNCHSANTNAKGAESRRPQSADRRRRAGGRAEVTGRPVYRFESAIGLEYVFLVDGEEFLFFGDRTTYTAKS
jgi:hypothetical protein